MTHPEKYDIIESDVSELIVAMEKYAQNCLVRAAARGLEEPRNIKINWNDWRNKMEWIE